MATQMQLQRKLSQVEKHRALSLFVFFCIGCVVCLLLNRDHSNDKVRDNAHAPKIQPVSKAIPAAKISSNDVDKSEKDGIFHPLSDLRQQWSIPYSCRLKGGYCRLTLSDSPPETLVTLGIRLQI